MECMKRTFIACALAVASASASLAGAQPREREPARDTADTEEELVSGPVEHGGYGAPEARVSTLFQKPVVFGGAQGGWILNHSIVIGGAGYATARRSPDEIAPVGMEDPYVAVGYGGVRVAVVLFPKRLVHVSFATLVGGGGAQISEWDGSDSDEDDPPESTDEFFVMEPEAALEVNLWKHTRLAVAGSYRYVSMFRSDFVEAEDLRGPALGLALKFGKF
jgi:hypothetical protein